jgi:hypothetical protein
MVSSAGLLLIVYLTIATNFVSDMFPCDVRKALTENVFAKHLVVFMAVFFFVADETKDPDSTTTFRHYVWRTCFIYLLFVMSCKCHTAFLLPALALLFAGELVRAYSLRSRRRADARLERLARWESGCKVAAVSLIVAGSAVYFATHPMGDVSTIQCKA